MTADALAGLRAACLPALKLCNPPCLPDMYCECALQLQAVSDQIIARVLSFAAERTDMHAGGLSTVSDSAVVRGGIEALTLRAKDFRALATAARGAT